MILPGVYIGDGAIIICASFDYDPEKIGKHMLEILAKFRSEGLVHNSEEQEEGGAGTW